MEENKEFGKTELSTSTGDTYIDLINALINDELEAIDGYNDAIVKVNAANFKAEKSKCIINALNHIRDEEQEHIEELKSLLNCNKDDKFDIDAIDTTNWYDSLSSLTEDNLVKNVASGLNKKVLTFAILTANNPLEQFISEDDKTLLKTDRKAYNIIKNKELKDLLKLGKINISGKEYPISYSQITGHYGDLPEKSFFIYNITLNQAKNFAQQFAQESFIFGDNREGQHSVSTYVAKINKTGDKILDYVQKETLDAPSITPNKDSEGNDQYYSQKRTFKFSFPFSGKAFDKFTEDLTDVWDIENEGSFRDSLKEYATGSYLFNKRKSAYHNLLTEAADIDSPEYFKAMLKAYRGLSKRNNGWAVVYGFTKNKKFTPLDPIYKDNFNSLQDVVKGLKTKEKGQTDVEVYTLYKDKLNSVKDTLIKKGLLKEDLDEK